MKKRSPKYLAALKKIDATKSYGIKDGLELVIDTAFAKFDETIEVSYRLGVDPRHADQMIRGAQALPAGTGKNVRVIVITSGDKIQAAQDAGADEVGSEELITKIQGGWMDFDRVIASPEMMGKIGKIARILGPRGLMPNPKLGTVTPNIANAVKEQKAGKVQYRTEKTGIIHVPIGKKSFGPEKLLENYNAMTATIVKAKPVSSKGTYIKSICVSATMGPGIRIDPTEALQIADNN